MKQSIILRTAFALLALSVVLGAFGAHTLEKHLTAESIKVWNTAVQYQVYHSLGLILLTVLPSSLIQHSKRIAWSQRFLLLGILFFSGSLYLLSTRTLWPFSWAWLGPITPLGGVCFIIGWVMAFTAIGKTSFSQPSSDQNK